jgi:hypothetical protein
LNLPPFFPSLSIFVQYTGLCDSVAREYSPCLTKDREEIKQIRGKNCPGIPQGDSHYFQRRQGRKVREV